MAEIKAVLMIMILILRLWFICCCSCSSSEVFWWCDATLWGCATIVGRCRQPSQMVEGLEEVCLGVEQSVLPLVDPATGLCSLRLTGRQSCWCARKIIIHTLLLVFVLRGFLMVRCNVMRRVCDNSWQMQTALTDGGGPWGSLSLVSNSLYFLFSTLQLGCCSPSLTGRQCVDVHVWSQDSWVTVWLWLVWWGWLSWFFPLFYNEIAGPFSPKFAKVCTFCYGVVYFRNAGGRLTSPPYQMVLHRPLSLSIGLFLSLLCCQKSMR